ncbi:hypothetical protein BJ165DRAFT_1494466 [Panaeolus papilionaceus]|nr:hypothetical protein BJ165DRAFT_1494466 [Panaeolus papilionaceus]
MMQLVKEAYRDATDTYETFRNVRKDLMRLSSRLLSEHEQDNLKNSDGTTFDRSAKDLGEEAEVLAQFCDNVSSFIAWWDWVRIEAESGIHQPDQRINFRIDSLKDPATVQRWQNLRVQYANYVQLVSCIQEQYAITLGPVKPKPATQISDAVHIFDEPLEDDHVGDSMAQGRSAAYPSKKPSTLGPNKPGSSSTKFGRAPADEREPGVNMHPIKKALTGSFSFLTKPLTARAHQRNPENKALGAIILELLKGGWMKLLRPHTGRKQSLP